MAVCLATGFMGDQFGTRRAYAATLLIGVVFPAFTVLPARGPTSPSAPPTASDPSSDSSAKLPSTTTLNASPSTHSKQSASTTSPKPTTAPAR